MPRQSRSRPTPRQTAPAPQSRGTHTAAAPSYGDFKAAPSSLATQTRPGAQTQSAAPAQQPGMLAQMAATAGSVAVGSTIGHGLSNMLFGGSSQAAAAEAPAAPVQQQYQQYSGGSCDGQIRDFVKCMDDQGGDKCSWYLEQLKTCQAAARPY